MSARSVGVLTLVAAFLPDDSVSFNVACELNCSWKTTAQSRAKRVAQLASAIDAREVVSDYLSWQVVINGGDSALEALDLETRYQLSFWYALVIQAAQAAGAEILYSEDLSDGQRYGGVRVRNPFAAAAERER